MTKQTTIVVTGALRVKLYGDDEGVIMNSIAPEKRRYLQNIFLISSRKHMLWVLIRSAPARHF